MFEQLKAEVSPNVVFTHSSGGCCTRTTGSPPS